MGFHPKMYSDVRGFTPLRDLQSLVVDEMAIDVWMVANAPAAGGHYVSIYPRIVVVLGGGQLGLVNARHGAVQRCSAFYIPAGVEVWSRQDAAGTLHHVDIHLTQRRLKTLLGGGPLPEQPILIEHCETLQTLAALLADCDRSAPVRERIADCIALEVFARGAHMPPPPPDADLFALLETHVRQNLGRKIAVTELCDLTGLSRTSLNLMIRRETDRSTYQWILEQKVACAAEYLTAGHACSEVAQLTGFADQAHFNRVFKAVTGHAPGHWRIEQAACKTGSIVQDK